MSSVITVKCRVARDHVPLLYPATVTITEDVIRCTFIWPWRQLLRDVVHRSRTVTVVHSLLMPPFWRVLLEIVGEDGKRAYATPNLGWDHDLQGELELRGYETAVRRRVLL